MTFKISASLVGLEEFNKALDEVKQKAEELEQAIQQLNDIELDIEFGDVKKEPTQNVDSDPLKAFDDYVVEVLKKPDPYDIEQINAISNLMKTYKKAY